MDAESLAHGASLLVPHEGDAVLLEHAWQQDPQTTIATAVPGGGNPFCDDRGGWPAWLAIELMAQTVAASATLSEFRPGQRARLGLLLGVRDFVCATERFGAKERLRIEAVEEMQDETGMGVFDCSLWSGERMVATATLFVYLPADVEEYLSGLEA